MKKKKKKEKLAGSPAGRHRRAARGKFELQRLKSYLQRPVRCPNWKIELRTNEMRRRTVAQSTFREQLVQRADVKKKVQLALSRYRVIASCTWYCVRDKIVKLLLIS